MKVNAINHVRQNSPNFCAKLGAYNRPDWTTFGVEHPSKEAKEKLAELIETSPVLNKCLAPDDTVSVGYSKYDSAGGVIFWGYVDLLIATKYNGKSISVSVPTGQTLNFHDDWDIKGVEKIATALRRENYAKTIQSKIMEAYREACICEEIKINGEKAEATSDEAERFDIKLVG